MEYEGRSLAALFSDLTEQLTRLLKQEVELAKTELGTKVSSVGRDIGFLVVGGVVLFAGFLALIATVILVLTRVGLPLWLSALIVAVVVTTVGVFMVQRGLNNLKRTRLAPRQTIDSLKESKEWAKEQVT